MTLTLTQSEGRKTMSPKQMPSWKWLRSQTGLQVRSRKGSYTTGHQKWKPLISNRPRRARASHQSRFHYWQNEDKHSQKGNTPKGQKETGDNADIPALYKTGSKKNLNQNSSNMSLTDYYMNRSSVDPSKFKKKSFKQ